MFPNIEREMAVRRLNNEQLGKELGICSRAMSNKRNGRNDFTRSEMLKIQKLIGGGMTLDELFKWVEG